MKADFTGSPQQTSNTDNVVLYEVANADKSITAEAKAINDVENDLKEERNTKS